MIKGLYKSLAFMLSLLLWTNVWGFDINEKVIYPLTNEPIDVVIPAIPKDLDTLDLCIEGIRNNCANVRRIIVVSPTRLTDQAEWMDEHDFPFNKFDVALYLNQMDPIKAVHYAKKPRSRVGWYLQQLLNFYAPYVIPGISSNVLILNSDTIFFRPVSFMNESGWGLYNPGTEYHAPYFVHTNKLLPGLKKVFPHLSGISHHMLFQRPILDDLFAQIETHHKKEFWKAFCLSVNPEDLELSGAADFEIYFNFAFMRTNQVQIRDFKWGNSGELYSISRHREEGYDYVSYHAYMRN